MTAPATTATPAADGIAMIAPAIEPVLNRVVLAGPPVIALLTSDSSAGAPQAQFATDSVLQLLTTAMIDRIGADLQRLGFSRIGHAESTDRWSMAPDLTLDLVQVRDDDRDHPWLEYATLLTMPHTVGQRITLRIAGAPSMLALECASFESAGMSVAESAPLERLLLLVAGRPELEHELASAPPELRSFVALTMQTILRSDALPLLIIRTLPDAALLPALTKRLMGRLRRMSGLDR